MDPLSFGLSAIGGLVSNLWTDKRQEEAQRFNAEQAQKQMDFQERMSSTAYQRGMADMRAGGLNPILAYQKGPASSPTGAAASTSFQAATDVITPAVSTALQGKRVAAEVENMVQTNENLKTQNKLYQAQIGQVGAQIGNITADTAQKIETLRALREQKSAEAAKAKLDHWYYESIPGGFAHLLGGFMKDLNPFISKPPVHIGVKPAGESNFR